jgi:hypothetical protein
MKFPIDKAQLKIFEIWFSNLAQVTTPFLEKQLKQNLLRPRPFQRAQIFGDRPLGTEDVFEGCDCLKKTSITSKLKPVKYIEGLIIIIIKITNSN